MLVNVLHDDFVACLMRADRHGASTLILRALQSGVDPRTLLLEVIQPAMQEVGRRWSRRRASLTQYFVAGRIGDDVTDSIVNALHQQGSLATRGAVVIGTIAGDYHGLGRKIVAAFLRAAGFQVHDLGLGVTPEQFVESAGSHSADIIAISGLMVHSVLQIKQVRPLLDRTGLGKVRILVGGAPFNYHRKLYRQVGADATARDAAAAASVAAGMLEMVVVS